MAHHKRRRPKAARAGCLLCRPHKVSGAPPDSRFRVSELRRIGGRARRVTKRVELDEDDLTPPYRRFFRLPGP